MAEETREERRERIRLSRLTPRARAERELPNDASAAEQAKATRGHWLNLEAEAERDGDEQKLRAVRRGLDNNAAGTAAAQRQTTAAKGPPRGADRPTARGVDRPRSRRRRGHRTCHRPSNRSDDSGGDGPGEPEPPDRGGSS